MGSMNSNNWLSFPDLSSSHHASLQASQSHQFPLGLVNGDMDNINPFQNQEWNLMDAHVSNDVPKVADFLGVSKSVGIQNDAVPYNEPVSSARDSDHLFRNNGLAQVVHQSSVMAATSSTYRDHRESPGNLQALTLSMGSGTGSTRAETSADQSSNNSTVEAAPRRAMETFGQRTSIYRGVTRHRWTGRYEAHLWDNSCRREGQSRKGRQVYLGGYDKEDKAARAYDLAALKYWGASTTTNFPISNYEKELEEMKHMTRQESVASIRRKSSGFSRGASMYRGVTRHHQHGRWQARIGRVAGNKDLYLGTFSTEEEAAEAYDIAAIKFRGLNAVTNFDMNRYDVKSILESNTLPIGGGAAKRLKEAQALDSSRKRDETIALSSAFQYGSSSTGAAYPTMSLHALDHNPLHYTLLTLQNHDRNTSHHYPTQDPQFSYNGYGNAQSHPAFLQGLVDNSTTGYSLGMASDSVTNTGNNYNGDPEPALVKVDYDVPSGMGYGGWTGSGSGSGSGQGSNPGAFSMWG